MKMRLWVSVLGAGLVMASLGGATTMVPLSLEQLTRAASVIVEAQMMSEAPQWNAAHSTIITVSTWKVSETFKGNPGATLEVEQPGGTVGNVRVYVSGVATFKPQTDYILFLEPAPSGSARYGLVGMVQGAFRISSDAGGQGRRVILPFSGLQLQNQVLTAGAPTVALRAFTKDVAMIRNQGVRIPAGLNLPVTIVSTEAQGAGRLYVSGRTTMELYPSRDLVVPAGSEVEGEAMRAGGGWVIHWTEVNVGGVRAEIHGTTLEDAGILRGRSLVLNVR